MDNSAALPAPRRISDTSSQPVSPASAASPLDGQTHHSDSEKQDGDTKIRTTETSIFLNDGEGGGHLPHAFEPVPCRSTAWNSFWGDAVLDVLQVLLVIPFVCLGIVVLTQNGKTTAEVKWIHHITAAISYGPTIFPILFSFIIGRLMKVVQYWKLERRATVETIEQLHGSRTVTSAVITQLKLQSFNLLAIAIVLLWALSPVGSQAALRVAAIVPVFNNVGFVLSYLDVRSPFSSWDAGTSNSLTVGLFTSSILMSQSEEAWDGWGNMRVPMVEGLEGSTPSLDWISTEGRNVSYASLIGIPTMINSTLEETRGTTNVSFSLDTSYWWLDCSTQQVADDSLFPDTDMVNHTFRDKSTRMAWRNDFRAVDTDPAALKTLPLNDTQANKVHDQFKWEPRRLDLIVNNTRKIGSRFAASCNLTSTFVTVNASCSGAAASQLSSTSRSLQRCRATAIRRTQLNATRSVISVLDMLRVGRASRANQFFEDFVSAAVAIEEERQPALSLQVGYLADPRSPSSFETDFPDWSAVSARDFGMRFARMLNTYWVAAVGYKPVQGNFDRSDSLEDDIPGGLRGSFSYEETNRGVAGIPREALRTDAVWTTVLLLVSAVLLAAAVTTLIMNFRRKIPSGIEVFSSLLRDTPHAQVMLGGQRWPMTTSSMLTGFERSRLLKDVVVQVGDVAPTAPYGYVAVGTPETVEMERLNKGRKYL